MFIMLQWTSNQLGRDEVTSSRANALYARVPALMKFYIFNWPSSRQPVGRETTRGVKTVKAGVNSLFNLAQFFTDSSNNSCIS